MTDDFDIEDEKNIEAMGFVRGMLEYISEGLKETPARVLSAMTEHFSGYKEDPREHLLKTFEEVLDPKGVAVIIQRQHFCMCHRGIHKPDSWTTTSKLTGSFLKNPSSQAGTVSIDWDEKVTSLLICSF